MASKDRFSPVVRGIIAPAWAAWEYSPYLRIYRQLERSQFVSLREVESRQFEALGQLIAHAFATCPFWRCRFDEVGLKPYDIRSLNDIRLLPLLTKQDLQRHYPDMRSTAYANALVQVKKTSGSTGVAVEVVVDEAAQQFKRAATVRSDQWSGWRLGERVACVWGNPEYVRRGWRGRLRNLLLERATYLDTLKMDSASMSAFTDRLRRKPPSLLFGHAHSLYLLAEYVRQNGGAGFQPRGIISTAMVLHDWQRRRIAEVFDCPVTNRYGCEEVSLIACECQRHDGLHVNAEGVFVEIVRSDGSPAAPGERGSVVVTDLQNHAMPMLRYKVGDTAIAADRVCPCGRGLPLLESIEGREADYVTTAAGEMISGISLTENFAMLVPGVGQLQIVQEAVDRFTFRIVRDHIFDTSSLARLDALTKERFGPGCTYNCEFVESIPQEPSGKYRFCISHVSNAYTSPTAVPT
ncbi:MAG TPA: hypothetical protein VGN12_06660 [Pirellulales bacterium]|jgi:phenylacetate-CoA ligase